MADSDLKFTEDHAEDVHTAVEKMFTMMFSVAVRSAWEPIKPAEIPHGDVVGIFGFHKVPRGALIVIFPKQTVFLLLKNLYGKEFTEIDKSGVSLVGEITNIVHGVFRTRMNEKGFSLGLGIPQVIVDAKPRIPDLEWAICGKFESGAGPFHVVLGQV